MLVVTTSQITVYRADGAVLISGLFKDWVEQIAAGIEQGQTQTGNYRYRGDDDDASSYESHSTCPLAPPGTVARIFHFLGSRA
jgi:hypothetical protein